MFKLVFVKAAVIGKSKAEINNHKEMKKDEQYTISDNRLDFN